VAKTINSSFCEIALVIPNPPSRRPEHQSSPHRQPRVQYAQQISTIESDYHSGTLRERIQTKSDGLVFF
jgi:hypothetical protein